MYFLYLKFGEYYKRESKKIVRVRGLGFFLYRIVKLYLWKFNNMVI